ncbi:hypothetical protein TanjilG_19897 [Lupinus angustifolius]|uniref:VQ domain-containing protein n=1 Tax=Lupinus angustifolius TaxID=3871 RepID=A0A1J7IHS8_LUPAN|nr:PREDICTED: protein MKS1-like [Lupinus angustifolius]OIW14481.1 hypothetical protein TanjilG_19897 [Lupinus angustifolius]
MDFLDIPKGRSPTRKLQGPPPTPLRIKKDSHKIKKTRLAQVPQLSLPQPPQQREPIIIYTVSPKVIHTTPSDFMNLVQRLTGSTSSSSLSLSSTTLIPSPAARYTTVEKARSPMVEKQVQPFGDYVTHVGGLQMVNQGILYPGPASLSPISSSLFSSPSLDPSMVSFIHELNTPNFISPHTPSTDLFNYFVD